MVVAIKIWRKSVKLGSFLALNIASIALVMPAFAQQEARQPDAEQEIAFPDDVKVNFVPVYGNDPCPESTEDEIVVCPEFDEGERYRIPKNLRNDPNDPANQSWTERAVSIRTLGASGTNSCSPSGAGGFAGCTQSLIDAAYAERRNAPNVEAGRLIAEERKKRLELIDAEAEDVERRILEIEKARADKEAAEIAAAQAAAEATLDPELKAEPEEDLPEIVPDQ